MKNRILDKFSVTFIICLIITVVLLLLSKFSLSLIFLICTIVYFIIYLIIKKTKINLIFLGHTYDFILLIPLILVFLYIKSDLYFNLSIYEFSSMIEKNMKIQESGIYDVYDRSIKNANGDIVLDWKIFGHYIEKGKIIVENEKIEYKLQIEDKCIYKKLGEKKYNIIELNCEGL